MEPKFKQGQRVKIADDLGSMMWHFDSGCEAIVDYCYDDKYGCGNIDSWSLALIDEDTGKIYNIISWYKTWQLTLVNEDSEEGIEMLFDYHGSKKRAFLQFSR